MHTVPYFVCVDYCTVLVSEISACRPVFIIGTPFTGPSDQWRCFSCKHLRIITSCICFHPCVSTFQTSHVILQGAKAPFVFVKLGVMKCLCERVLKGKALLHELFVPLTSHPVTLSTQFILMLCCFVNPGKTCDSLINHCECNPCFNGGSCQNRVDGYYCHCLFGE